MSGEKGPNDKQLLGQNVSCEKGPTDKQLSIQKVAWENGPVHEKEVTRECPEQKGQVMVNFPPQSDSGEKKGPDTKN